MGILWAHKGTVGCIVLNPVAMAMDYNYYVHSTRMHIMQVYKGIA